MSGNQKICEYHNDPDVLCRQCFKNRGVATVIAGQRLHELEQKLAAAREALGYIVFCKKTSLGRNPCDECVKMAAEALKAIGEE